MKRVSLNKNLFNFYDSSYQGIPIQVQHGPLVENYLQRMHECFDRALIDYSRVSMIRFDLHVPDKCAPEALNGNELIYRFFSSLKAKIKHSQEQSQNAGHRVHHTNLRYIWCREISDNQRVHFHIALLLNGAAYSFIGKFELCRDNMYARIHQAWGSALHIHAEDVKGLVHIPENPTYQILRGDTSSFQEAFHRVSYLCKVRSKEFGN